MKIFEIFNKILKYTVIKYLKIKSLYIIILFKIINKIRNFIFYKYFPN